VDDDFLVEKIRSSGSDVVYVPVMEDITRVLQERVRANDTVVFFGGDDLFAVADAFAAQLDKGKP